MGKMNARVHAFKQRLEKVLDDEQDVDGDVMIAEVIRNRPALFRGVTSNLCYHLLAKALTQVMAEGENLFDE